MSFDIPIKVDPQDSLPEIKGVEDALEQAERRGREAGQTMLRLSGAFGKLAEAIRREREALDRTTRLHDDLTRKNQPLVRSFNGLAEAMRREQQILERIHGPARQYAQDLEIIDSLLARNKISTAQYANEVTRLNQRLRETPTPKETQRPTLTGGVRALAGSPGLATRGALVGGLLLAGREAEQLILEQEQIEDRYARLTNVALKFANDGRTVNTVLDTQRRLARDLHADLGQTMDLYDGIANATRNLGFTSRELTQITEILGKEMVNSNKPVSDASALVQRLSVAFEVGRGAGQQFLQIMREHPALADAAAKAYGTNLAGLVQLVDQGKVKLPELTQAWVKHGQAISQEHAKRKKTHEQLRAEVIQDAEIAMNRGVPTLLAFTEGGRKLHDILQQTRAPGREFADVIGDITAEVAELARKWQITEDATKGAAAVREMNSAISALLGGLRDMSSTLDVLGKKLGESTTMRAFGIAAERGRDVAAARKELEALNLAYKTGGREAVPDYIARKRELLDVINGVTATMKAEREELRKYNEEIRRLNSIRPRNVLGTFEMQRFTPSFPTIEDPTARLNLDVHEVGSRLSIQEQMQAEMDIQADAIMRANARLLEAADKQKEKAREVRDAWAQGLGSISAEIVNMAMEGEISIDRLAGSLAKLALQIAASQIGGPWGTALGAFAGGLGGFASGGSGRVPGGSDPFYLPRAANGLSGRIGGVGGTDSKIFMARVTPGEFFEFRTPQQQARREAATMPAVNIRPQIVVQSDPREIASAAGSFSVGRQIVRLQRQFNQRR